jgi:hypothetical protein
MALNVPDVGEKIALEAFINKTAPQDQSLRLFINNFSPSDTDVAGTHTIATFPGYANIALTGANWNAYAGGSVTYNAQQTFACSGVATDDVYGYYLLQSVSGILMWNERDATAPFAVRNNGDSYKITPTIGAN